MIVTFTRSVKEGKKERRKKSIITNKRYTSNEGNYQYEHKKKKNKVQT